MVKIAINAKENHELSAGDVGRNANRQLHPAKSRGIRRTIRPQPAADQAHATARSTGKHLKLPPAFEGLFQRVLVRELQISAHRQTPRWARYPRVRGQGAKPPHDVHSGGISFH